MESTTVECDAPIQDNNDQCSTRYNYIQNPETDVKMTDEVIQAIDSSNVIHESGVEIFSPPHVFYNPVQVFNKSVNNIPSMVSNSLLSLRVTICY